MTRNPSPLRYPGGKVSLTDVLKSVIYANNLQGGTYIEPFAGGAGAGLKLLQEGHVQKIIINDRDRAIFSFWKSVMRQPDVMIKRIKTTPLTMEEWHRQRTIYRSPSRKSQIDLGFAAFYLNRCNRSGIIMKAGPIGGVEQKGKWKIDARFNRDDLASRVEEISSYGERITVLCEDAASLIQHLPDYADEKECFVYADPPYYVKGSGLYLNPFDDAGHVNLARLMLAQKQFAWVMTYDDVQRIREIYQGAKMTPFKLRYSAHKASLEGGEILIAPNHITIPSQVDVLLASRARNASLKVNV